MSSLYNKSKFYQTHKWRKIRANQLMLEPICKFCEQRGKVTLATVADHIEPHRGDEVKFFTGDLQSLCAPCHSSIKQRQENGKDVRVTGLDGWKIG